MEKKLMKIAAIAALAGLVMTSCGSSKNVAGTSAGNQPVQSGQQVQSGQLLKPDQPPPSETDREVERINNKKKIDSANVEAKIKENEMAAKLLRSEAELERLREQVGKSTPILEVQIINIPCFAEALDKEPEKYITGFGIGEPGKNDDPFSQALVYENALVRARNTIGDKWLGFIKNISNNYYNRVNVPSGTESTQANFERAVRTGGEKAINNFNAVLCQQMTKTERGTYVCYMATRVSLEELKTKIANEFETLKIKYDQNVLFETLEEELKNQAAKEKEDLCKLRPAICSQAPQIQP
ncbi:MAG: hypothetical protein LBQ28_03885 [Prevotellaceae bacterium]|jgi:hypothetical protein|nr:hypothetical protein [Prevotellaceae bacterium]